MSTSRSSARTRTRPCSPSGRELEAGRRHDLGVQAAQGRQVPGRIGIHRRRRGAPSSARRTCRAAPPPSRPTSAARLSRRSTATRSASRRQRPRRSCRPTSRPSASSRRAARTRRPRTSTPASAPPAARSLQVCRVQAGRPRHHGAQRRLLGPEAGLGEGHLPLHELGADPRRGPARRRRRPDRERPDLGRRAPQGERQPPGGQHGVEPRDLLPHGSLPRGLALHPAKDGSEIKNPLRDKRVRQALSMAINRQAIVDRIMEKEAIPPASSCPSSSSAPRRS